MQVIYMTMYVSVCVTESFICESTSNRRVKHVCKDGKLLFTKNVHIPIRDGGKRKAGVRALFSVFGQMEKGRDVGGKFVGDRRFT